MNKSQDVVRDIFMISLNIPYSSFSLSLFIFSTEILTRIENVILGIVTSLSKDEAPVLVLPNRSSWANVR